MSNTNHTASAANAQQTPWRTVPEAADYARLGQRAIYDACRAGQLKARQTSTPRGKWLIHLDDLDKYLRSLA
jgi:excisionase family DNA binding protein